MTRKSVRDMQRPQVDEEKLRLEIENKILRELLEKKLNVQVNVQGMGGGVVSPVSTSATPTLQPPNLDEIPIDLPEFDKNFETLGETSRSTVDIDKKKSKLKDLLKNGKNI